MSLGPKLGTSLPPQPNLSLNLQLLFPILECSCREALPFFFLWSSFSRGGSAEKFFSSVHFLGEVLSKFHLQSVKSPRGVLSKFDLQSVKSPRGGSAKISSEISQISKGGSAKKFIRTYYQHFYLETVQIKSLCS